jgi:hypothetical protein
MNSLMKKLLKLKRQKKLNKFFNIIFLNIINF